MQTTTGHTLTVDGTYLRISGDVDTMDGIPDAELRAAAESAGMAWTGEVVDETTYRLARPLNMTTNIEWTQADSGANVRVSDGEETYFARVPADWDEARVATAFLSTYEVLPEVVREWGSKGAFLRDLRGKLEIDFV